MNIIQEISERLLEKQQQSTGLMLDLMASLAIQKIWPDAWANKCTVKVCAREVITTMWQARRLAAQGKTPKLKSMYLLRSDGEQFPLNAEQYWHLKSFPRSGDTHGD